LYWPLPRFDAARASPFDQYAPHRICGDAVEVSAVLPADALLDQSKIDFVHKRGGLQRVVEALSTEITLGDPMQFVVDDGYYTIECILIAFAPLN